MGILKDRRRLPIRLYWRGLLRLLDKWLLNRVELLGVLVLKRCCKRLLVLQLRSPLRSGLDLRLLYRCICTAWGEGTNIDWGLSKDSLRCIGHLGIGILLIDKSGRGYVANGGTDGLLDFES